MVGEKNGIEPKEVAASSHALGVALAVKRGRAVEMKIGSDQVGAEVSANVEPGST